MACVRRAWLVLGAATMPLESEAAGYFCSSLDLGYPEVREVTNPRPNASGTDDQTALYGARVITAAVTALAGAGASIDGVYGAFAPYVSLAARPELHYVLDRPGSPERVITGLRAAAYAGPIAGPFQRDMQLQWVAPDPIIYGAALNLATAWAGSGAAGRVYAPPWRPPRVYPSGSTGPVNGDVVVSGDVSVKPYVRIFGPITNPRVQFYAGGAVGNMPLVMSIDAGHFVGIDCNAHTVLLDDLTAQSRLSSVDWSTWRWGVLPPGPARAGLSITGTGTTSSSQAQATWRDGYLT